MISARQWCCAALAASLFALTGVSYIARPNYELAYELQAPGFFCPEKPCLAFYYLKLGNTGWKEQDVTLEFTNDVFDSAAIPLKARNFGKVPRKVDLERGETSTRVRLGTLESGKVVEINFVLEVSSRDAMRPWDSVLRKIEPTKGGLIKGSTEVTTFFRFLFGIFGA